MDFQVIDVSTGKVSYCDIYSLSQNLSVNCEILRRTSTGHEAIGFVTYEVLRSFVVHFAQSVYERTMIKDKMILAAIDGMNKFLKNQITHSEMQKLFDNAQQAALDVTFIGNSSINVIATNNVVLAAASCANTLGIIDQLPSYALSAIDSENKDAEKKAQGTFILQYFDAL